MSIASARLLQERRRWRKDHPPRFFAKPERKEDGTLNLFKWTAGIPGNDGTDWEGGVYPLTMEFTREYPAKPPKCKFPEKFYHPNIYPSGTVCLDILNENENWGPSISIKQMLMAIAELLHNPNIKSPAQRPAFITKRDNPEEYSRVVKEQARFYRPK